MSLLQNRAAQGRGTGILPVRNGRDAHSPTGSDAAEIAPSLYIHVPWCRSRCRYCAFHSTATGGASLRVESFAREIGREIADRAPAGFAPEAIYVGGGTPSLLGADGIRLLCRTVRNALDAGRVREWTFEANPDSLDTAVCKALLEGGCTRLSLGVQSLDDWTLRWLARPHDAARARAAYRLAREAGFVDVGIDLIAGIPGEAPDAWRRTLDEACEWGCDHVSVYALSIEPGTPLEADVRRGAVVPLDDDAMLDALVEAESALGAASLVRYEISNYARPGRECLYNLSVWRGGDYLGVGPSASSRMGLERRTNATKPGVEPDTRLLSVEEDRRERFLTGLRILEGAEPGRWLGPDEAERARATFRRLEGHGIVESAGADRWRLTARGREVADAVALELL